MTGVQTCALPISNYHFNQGIAAVNNSTVTTLTDVSGNSNSGPLTNFALTGATSNWVAPGGVISGSITPAVCPVAAALNFDGVNDYIDLGNGITTSLTGSTKISLEAWVNPSSLSGLGCIVGNYNTGFGDMQFLLRRSSNSYYEFWVGNGGLWYNTN